jgi:hypothetical protein
VTLDDLVDDAPAEPLPTVVLPAGAVTSIEFSVDPASEDAGYRPTVPALAIRVAPLDAVAESLKQLAARFVHVRVELPTWRQLPGDDVNRRYRSHPAVAASFDRPSDRAAERELALAVARLDAVAPYWRRRVRAESLELRDIFRCVLGQVFGDYDTGLWELYGVGRSGPGCNAFCGSFPAQLWLDELARDAPVTTS